MELAALENRLTDLRVNFRKLLWFYLGSMMPFDSTMFPLENDQEGTVLEMSTMLLAYLTGYQSQQRPPENRWATSHRQEESWKLRPGIFGVCQGPNYYKLLLLYWVSFVYALDSYPAKWDKLVMPDCHRTKGTLLLCLTDLQPVALKRQSIAPVGIYIDL